MNVEELNVVTDPFFCFCPAQRNKTEKKNRRRGRKGEAEEEEGSAPGGPTEVIKEIVTEDGTVITIKEVIPGAQEKVEEEEEEQDEGKMAHMLLNWWPS